MTPSVSVIVPVYKVEKYIGQCARSLFSQTYPACEFIFVDDGSPDRSVDVLREVIAEYPALNARIISQPNKGLPVARKTGLDAATGDYVLHVDSDDWIEPDTVEKLVACALAGDADIVVYDLWKWREGGHKHLNRERERNFRDRGRYIRGLYQYRAYGYIVTKFARRSLYDGIFVPRNSMHEDIVFSTQLLMKAGRVVHLEEPLYWYRRSAPGSTTHLPKAVRRKQSVVNMLDYLDFCGGTVDVPYVTEEILLRAGWVGFSLCPELFRERPGLMERVKKIPLRAGMFEGILKQLILKIWIRFQS